MRIAVIDDEKGILLSVSLFLELEGHTPLTFSSPLEALKSINGENVDLIILDMRMPEMNGERVANLLKANPETRNIPLILFSAHESLPEVAERVGAQGILEKPFHFEKLNDLINSFLQ
ncbi:response regulator [Thermanaerosceptrum fracticalcis]|uniref:response regulator n=1 Tax=Thermanaerosceptrum fracticalcis TaxID=1712410 RepID=UPI000689AA1C|nr:response regulator [Thermanaerosceptrum fracticalcis]